MREAHLKAFRWLTTLFLLSVGPDLRAQTPEQMVQWFRTFDLENCVQDVPAPALLREPRYTHGTSNQLSLRLPAPGDLPVPVDSIKTPFIKTLVFDESGQLLFDLPRPVDLLDDALQTETVVGLAPGVRYRYTSALVLPVCQVACEDVVDPSQLEFHCSAFVDTVWSIQDVEPPEVRDVRIPQLDSTAVPGWWNRSRVEIQAQLSDPAGVWQSQLYSRPCGQDDWTVLADTTFPGELSANGYVFPPDPSVRFRPELPDGCYEFRVEGRDATHTPESHEGRFELAGNAGQPRPDAPAHARIQIDATPPDPVTLACQQVLNSLVLSWSPSRDPQPGIGLAGYRILRDGALLATVAANDTTFVDAFSEDAEDATFSYQVQPFDSLQNVQTSGGTAECPFSSVTQIVMAPEPVYSPGDSNQVCWQGSKKFTSYTVFVAADCDYSNVDSVQVVDTCFTFRGLDNGVTYCYWVKGVDAQLREVFSDTVRSTQDATAPEITFLNVPAHTVLRGENWVTRRETQLRLSATDAPPGQIVRVEVDIGEARQNLAVATASLDTTFDVVLPAVDCTPVAITARVFDGAGNVSAERDFVVRVDEEPPQPVTDLTCEQLRGQDGVQLQWQAAADAPGCSGLAGYFIVRNGVTIDTVGGDQTAYRDLLPADQPSGRIAYEVQPFDSLGLVQPSGPTAVCDYVGNTRISIEPLPKYTAGLSQRIRWSVSAPLVETTLFLDRGCDAAADDSVRFEGQATEFEHTFSDLEDGVLYCYWVTGEDAQARTVRSDTVRSVQDNTSPEVLSLTLQQSQVVENQVWLFERTVKLELRARDAAPGVVQRYEIEENGRLVTREDFLTARSEQDEVLEHELQADGTQPTRVTLTVRVFDGADLVSEDREVSFTFQKGLPPMYAYPNPFNPLQGKMIIRLQNEAETEVRIFDFFGNLVRVLTSKENSRDFVWDGRNGKGEVVANGGYICVGTKTGARFKIGVKKLR